MAAKVREEAASAVVPAAAVGLEAEEVVPAAAVGLVGKDTVMEEAARAGL